MLALAHFLRDLLFLLPKIRTCLCVYVMVMLFTNVPIPQALEVVRKYLQDDNTLKPRTLLTGQGILAKESITRIKEMNELLHMADIPEKASCLEVKRHRPM